MKGECRNGAAIVRPPGHHACRDNCSGFCYINNVLVAAFGALTRNPDLKILIVDWDVHYHSGTSDILKRTTYTSSQIVVFSMHRYDHGCFFPGDKEGATGSYHHGRIVNKEFNMPRGRRTIPGDEQYNTELSKFLSSYKHMYGEPDIIIVSCGFDAAKGDPLGGFNITPQGYYDMTTQLMRASNGKVAMVLEGGYNISVITDSAIACTKAMMN
jgi:histone deacetylase 6